MPKGNYNHIRCCVSGCSTRGEKNAGLTFHHFPKDDDQYMVKIFHPEGRIEKVRRRRIWVERLLGTQFNPKSIKWERVCGRHFAPTDFVPTSRKVRKAAHLKKNAIPTLHLPFESPHQTVTVGNDENFSNLEQEGAISETKLPDGSVCEFYSTFTDDEKSTSEDIGDESELIFRQTEAAELPLDGSPLEKCAVLDRSKSFTRKRKASDDPLARLDGLKPTKISPQQCPEECEETDTSNTADAEYFEAIDKALEQGSMKLPSSRWSHTRLGQSLIMFLCWDKDLRLVKKAVLHKDSQMCLYVGDQLIADVSTRELFDLGSCLRLLDSFVECKGLNSKSCAWSENCAKYTFVTDGNQTCDACRQVTDSDATMPTAFSGEGPASSLIAEESRALQISALKDTKPKAQCLRAPTIAECTKDPQILVKTVQNESTTNVSPVVPNFTEYQDAAVTQKPANMSESFLKFMRSDRHLKLEQALQSLGVTSNSEDVSWPVSNPIQNGRIDSTDLAPNPGYAVVVRNDGTNTPSIQPSVILKRTPYLEIEDSHTQPVLLKNRVSRRAGGKPTARKSTGGPRQRHTSSENLIDSETNDVVPLPGGIRVPIEDVFEHHC